MLKVNIIGNGVFGTFLKEYLKGHVEFSDQAFHIIMAVPVSAYLDVARRNRGKHLINVCSVQNETNKICAEHSDYVTGIHPMFGPNSPVEGRTCIITKTCSTFSEDIISIFENKGCEIVRGIKGNMMNGLIHDDVMRRTHLPVLSFGELAALIIQNAGDIPDNCLPPSYKKLKALADQMKDMSPGTVESIRSNL